MSISIFRQSANFSLFFAASLFCFSVSQVNAQDNMDSLMAAMAGPPKANNVMATFKTTRLVNLVTIEQVKRGELDFRISHRFDDISGDAGGIKNLVWF